MRFGEFMRPTSALSLALLVLLGLAACGGEGAGDTAGPDTATAVSVAGNAPPAMEDLPTCDVMFDALGDMASDLVRESSGGAGDGRFGDERKYGISCGWVTQQAVDPDLREAIKTSGVSLQVVIETDPLTEADYRAMGWAAEDPRVEAVDGVLVVPGGKFDLHGKLGVTGVAVVIDRVYVAVGAGGMYLGRNDSARNLTNDQAIDAAIAVHRTLASAS